MSTITPIQDPVFDDDETALEIGFTLPDIYNASAILFDNLDKGYGERTAIRTKHGTTNYRELCEAACSFGHALLKTGLKRGERVLLLLDDTPTYPAALFGAIRAGFVPMLINTLSTPDLIQFYLQDSGAKAAIVDGAFLDLIRGETITNTSLETLIVTNTDALPNRAINTLLASSLLATMPRTLNAAETHRNDMAFWMYSSGSTGRPKGVVHLQHDLAYSAASYADHILKLTPDDICFSVPKIFFAYGLGNSLTFPFSKGASSILMAGRPDPNGILDHCENQKPTVFFGLPTLYTAIVNAPQAATTNLGSVRLFISAAEVLASEIAVKWAELTGKDIIEGLGSTEMTHIYLSNTVDTKKAGSAGKRVPGYTLKLTDREGNLSETGEEGILWIKGHSSSPCYWNRPDKTAETMRGEWLWTGDRFDVDEQGFYSFKGRADDLIKVSGQWVYPLEVELCLADHPDIRECAVIACELPDRRMTLNAYVVLKSGTGDASITKTLQNYVKAQLLPHKYPRSIEYLDELPKTGTGKIDRQTLIKGIVNG